jgi:ABC-type dipeptide/oligopeptide/nickel transport system ATPase component
MNAFRNLALGLFFMTSTSLASSVKSGLTYESNNENFILKKECVSSIRFNQDVFDSEIHFSTSTQLKNSKECSQKLNSIIKNNIGGRLQIYGERLMATGARHYGNIRATAQHWLEEVEIPASRIDDLPTTFSGGMQQRLQIARNLVTHPKLVFMDEPTGGLDVSVQARLLDLLRGLVVELNLAVVIVTHDLGVARLLADRLLVMKQGQVVESGLTDRVLDDPHHPYTQLLVSSVLQN